MGWEEVRYGCIGEHLGHSFSREIHTMLGDYDYRLCELAPEEVESFLLAKKFCGINVTIPYKQTVIPYLDEVDPAARRIGAVNTVLHKNGKLIGYNTDYYGMRALLLRAGIDLRGQQVAILGSGGTSATAWAVAQDAGAAGIVRVSRHPKKEGDEIGYAELYRRADRIGAIINTTPVGMFPHEEGLAVDPTAFAHLCGVADAVYHPLCTSLVCRAATMGIPATGGLYMLVAQAAKAAELFFDDLSMTEKTEAVFQRILWQKQNIVLIGMPGSGKSTLGRRIADLTGKAFYDSDALIEARTGMTCGAYLETRGEEAFRLEETAVLREVSQKSGCVIATGGGAVTRRENTDMLMRNGVTVFLDRPLADIRPTAERPLTRNRELLERKYAVREPLYREAADVIFPVYGSPEEAAGRLLDTLRRTPEKGGNVICGKY